MESILVTGGAGYIGAHMVLCLLEAGYKAVVLDNLCNSSVESLRRVEGITGKKVAFIEGDIRDVACLEEIFKSYNISAVMHFAGLKAVGESVSNPVEYFDCNVVGSLRLFDAMRKADVKKLVFSSSATVYGDPASVPIQENFPLAATNPYGMTKLHVEDMLRCIYQADNKWAIALLRYFNPVGAHESGKIGESPNGVPNNLMPFVAQVAAGKREAVNIFGNDYPTPDGTGVRDYIHVMDLVDGHLAALSRLLERGGLIAANLGTGKGYSVLEMVKAFSQACGKEVPYRFVDRRPGDVAQCYADPSLALRELGWQAKHTLEKMCADHWRWQSLNPDGY